MSKTLPDKIIVAGIDVGSSAVKIAVLEDRVAEPPRVLIGRHQRLRLGRRRSVCRREGGAVWSRESGVESREPDTLSLASGLKTLDSRLSLTARHTGTRAPRSY